MRLLSMTVKNFRSITRPSKFPLTNFSVLLGPNNEGKSNVLRALELAMQTALHFKRATPRSVYRAPYESRYNWERDFPVQLQDTHADGRSEFVLEFELTEQEEDEFETEVGSRVKSPLPIAVVFGRNDAPAVSVHKKGPGSRKVSEKRALVSEFLSKRVDFDYVPAVRTAESAQRVVSRMVERELATLEDDPEYVSALKRIESLQQPILAIISQSLRDTLNQFLPLVTDVKVEVSAERRFEALRRTEIYVNDGVSTELKYKGDGAQSLSALALMRRAASTKPAGKHIVLALEEPESHLHPQGIHELRDVLHQLSETQQVILTTHCPLFVDRHQVDRHILVKQGRAHPAKSLDQIRMTLGVRAADNLRHADLVLVVEGADDRIALNAIVRARSAALRSALQVNRLAIDEIGGAGKLPYKLGMLRNAICPYFCFLDGDAAGMEAAKAAIDDGLLADSKVAYARLQHLNETEFEDLLDDGFVHAFLLNKYAVTWGALKPNYQRRKWSDRAAEVFRLAGKPWDEEQVKLELAKTVDASPGNALRPSTAGIIDNLITVLEARVAAGTSKPAGKPKKAHQRRSAA